MRNRTIGGGENVQGRETQTLVRRAGIPCQGRGRGVRSIVTSWPVRGSRIVMAASYTVGTEETPDHEEGSRCSADMVSNSLLRGVLSHLEIERRAR